MPNDLPSGFSGPWCCSSGPVNQLRLVSGLGICPGIKASCPAAEFMERRAVDPAVYLAEGPLSSRNGPEERRAWGWPVKNLSKEPEEGGGCWMDTERFCLAVNQPLMCLDPVRMFGCILLF